MSKYFTPYGSAPIGPKQTIKRAWNGDYELVIYRNLPLSDGISNKIVDDDWDAVEELLLKALEDVRRKKEEDKL